MVDSPADLQERRRLATVDMLREALQDGTAPVGVQVSGQCMEPLIIDGDEIIVVPLTSPPGIGDLVLGHLPSGELVCHRVVGFQFDSYLLAGDRSLHADQHRRESLLGRVESVRRGSLRLPIGATDFRHRLQVRLGRLSRRYRRRFWIRALEWPRRLLIEWQAVGHYWARIRGKTS